MTKKQTCTALILVGLLALICFFGGYFAGNANASTKIAQRDQLWSAKLDEARATQESYRSSYEADIDGLVRMSDKLRSENEQLKDDVAKLEGSDYENHSDWLDCYASLKYIDEHIEEIDKIDATNPVPIIYLKDGRTMCANGSHVIEEIDIPISPVIPTPPPTPSTTESCFTPDSSKVASIAYISE